MGGNSFGSFSNVCLLYEVEVQKNRFLWLNHYFVFDMAIKFNCLVSTEN